jgi:hypothetical protein
VIGQLHLRTLDDVSVEQMGDSLGDLGQSFTAMSSSGTEEVSTTAHSTASSAAMSRPSGPRISTTKMMIDFSSIKDLPAPPILLPEEVGLPANEFKFGLRVKVQGYVEPVIQSAFLPWQEGVMQFSSKLVLNFPVTTRFRDALKHKEGLTIQLVQHRVRYDLKPEPEVEEPIPGKKAKPVAAPVKKKKGAAFTAEELEAGYDAVIAEERILFRNYALQG